MATLGFCINRTILECKEFVNTILEKILGSINRTILECKAKQRTYSINCRHSINRTILECKDRAVRQHCEKGNVLIEPYWNVKLGSMQGIITVCPVLIEPYWNVKVLYQINLFHVLLCINRTILECKVRLFD